MSWFFLPTLRRILKTQTEGAKMIAEIKTKTKPHQYSVSFLETGKKTTYITYSVEAVENLLRCFQPRKIVFVSPAPEKLLNAVKKLGIPYEAQF